MKDLFATLLVAIGTAIIVTLIFILIKVIFF